MTSTLLIEIGVEELPAIPFLKEESAICAKWTSVLKQYKLFAPFEFYYTPRKLVLWHQTFSLSQEDSVEEYFGPPLNIAYKEGEPTKAALSFEKKCGVSLKDISTAEAKNGEVLYCKKSVKGMASHLLLNEMVQQFILSLDFGKSMRWSDGKGPFIRPIRSLSLFLDNKLVDGTLLGISSTQMTFVHRMISSEPLFFQNDKEYFKILENNGICLSAQKRKEMILDQIRQVEENYNVRVEVDQELLSEVVAITEYPTVLMGSFDESFLQLPVEVVVTSMKDHQRYFAVYNNDTLDNKFIVVSNAYTSEYSYIIEGNEKVLNARLSDAMFFYHNDLNSLLDGAGLDQLMFVKGLGSMAQKSKRELDIACFLVEMYGVDDKRSIIEEAIELSYTDLMSEMVFEFTQLQGIMGFYYAKAKGKNPLVCTAIKEQYLPNGETSALPSNVFSSIVAMAKKIDTIMALFSIDKIPTGSKDPFGLRRAATGVIKISIEHELSLDLNFLFETLSHLYKKQNTDELLAFFHERLLKVLDVNPSILKAVLASGDQNILSIYHKVLALKPLVQGKDYKEYSNTFKRVSNSIRDLDTNISFNVNTELFEEEAEHILYNRYCEIHQNEVGDYHEKLTLLFNLKPELDQFFDTVRLNHENESIQMNRKNLIGLIYAGFKTIADIKEITL